MAQQPVAPADRLRRLQVGVAGHEHVQLRLGAVDGRADQRGQQRRPGMPTWSRSQSRTSVATWSLRLRPVCSLPATGPMRSPSRRST